MAAVMSSAPAIVVAALFAGPAPAAPILLAPGAERESALVEPELIRLYMYPWTY